jgi:RND family efflux transporter MFP subunit
MLNACQSGPEDEKERTIAVKAFTIEPDTIASFLEISGNLEADNDALVISQVSEKMDRILQPVGSRVQKGQIIAVLDNEIWEESLKQAEASLESIKARHAQVRADYERYQRLYEEKAVSQQQWEKIRSSWQEAEATLAQLNAAYQQARVQFENTYIKAPFDGVVGSLFFDVGQMVPVGQPVAKIVNTNLMKAKLNIPDMHIRQIEIGQMVVARFPSLPEHSFSGVVQSADPAIDPLSRTVEVEVIYQNEDGLLKSGMYGQFLIELERRTGVVVLPDNAVISRTSVDIDRETGVLLTSKKYFVFTVNSETAHEIQVETGITSYGRTEIISGIKPGDQVIVVGQRIVKDGQKVRVTN